MAVNKEQVAKTRYCRDCQFSRNKHSSESDWQCRSPKNVTIHPVNFTTVISIITGDPVPQFDTCTASRSHNAPGCGANGNWFMTPNEYMATLTTQPMRGLGKRGGALTAEDI